MKNTIKILWLDDTRDPFTAEWCVNIKNKLDMTSVDMSQPIQVDVVWAKNANEFKVYFKHLVPDMIHFDHDLGEDETGYDCMKWLCEYCLDNGVSIPKCYSHSSNPIGRANILGYYSNFVRFNPIS